MLLGAGLWFLSITHFYWVLGCAHPVTEQGAVISGQEGQGILRGGTFGAGL